MNMADLFILLAREFGIHYKEVLELPDEIYHLYIERLFHVLSKQVGMGSVGYDFRDERTKQMEKFLDGE